MKPLRNFVNGHYSIWESELSDVVVDDLCALLAQNETLTDIT